MDDGAGVGMGNEDGKADGFFGEFDGIVHGPIGAPTGEENAIGEDNGDSIYSIGSTYSIYRFSRDGLDAGTEAGESIGEEDIAAEIAVAGTECILHGHIHYL